MTIQNPYLPKDTDGNTVHAHGGHIFFHEGYYYWIGENRTENNKVSCYKSKDFSSWEFCNHILTLDSETKTHYVKSQPHLDYPEQKARIGKGCNIERPKVIYNEKYNKFVMWMHWEMPDDYKEARCAIAVCDTIDGDYTYLGSFNPMGNMSRDCTLFVDDDKTAYFISAARFNQDLHIYKLAEDYLSIDRQVRVLWPNQSREAPTLFKKNGLYYMLTSACSGWNPNQSSYAYSTSIDGDWTMRKDFGDATTYDSQPTSVLPITKDGNTTYYYIGDRWGGKLEAYFNSTTIILPIQFGENNEISIDWQDEVSL